MQWRMMRKQQKKRLLGDSDVDDEEEGAEGRVGMVKALERS